MNETTKNKFNNKLLTSNLGDIVCEADADRTTYLLHVKIIATYHESCPIQIKILPVKDQSKLLITDDA